MFLLLLVLAFSAMHAYVCIRAASVPVVARNIHRGCLAAAALLLWLLPSAGLMLVHGRAETLAVIVETAGMCWLGVCFLLATTLLMADIVTGFGLLRFPFTRTLRGWALGAGLLLSALAFFQGLRPPVVRRMEAVIPGLPAAMEGRMVAVLSDLHLGPMNSAGSVGDCVARVNALKPDLVLVAGDLIESHSPPPAAQIDALRRLSAPLGVWGVLGNHECFGGAGRTAALIESTSIRLLRNTHVQLLPGLVLAGVDDPVARRIADLPPGDPLAEALAGRPGGSTILLSHRPDDSARAAAMGVNLMLSGHTHGGQIWPFSHLVQRRHSLLAGRYQVDGMTVIVSRGTGTWGPRMRLWHPGEILAITLHAKPR